MTKRVAVYARVSTSRQAANDISIPDQLNHAERYCAQKGWEIVATFVDRGASARDENRPEFQRLMASACVDPSPFDVILVHSQSRFFRDAISLGIHVRKLEAHGVNLLSMTQDVGEGAQAELMRTILGAVDAHQSAETSKHVSRTMAENARQGFWNGSKPPFGYRTEVAEQRGDKAKKKLVIDPRAAEIVRLTFDLALHGDGRSGPMGVKKIAETLNARGFKTATGSQFRTGYVHKILTNTAYMGTYFFNQRDGKTQKIKPREEWIPFSVPEIVSAETFQAVQDRLRSRSPDKVAPRVVTSPVMLGGVAHCSSCGSGLLLVTGKSGQYRYMACASKHTKGKQGCAEPARLPEKTLDDLVIDAIEEKVCDPDRIRHVLREVQAANKSRKDDAGARLKDLRKQLRDTEAAIERLYEALEAGTVANSASFQKRLKKQEERHSELLRLIGLQERAMAVPAGRITDQQVARFSRGLKTMLRQGTPEFRKAYLRLLLEDVRVSKSEIVITGSKAALAAAACDRKAGNGEVLGFVPAWRTGEDSNPRPPDS